MDAGDTMPIIIVLVHLLNLFCVIVLIRSGLHILADHPLLYWTDHTRRDNYWLKFGKKDMPVDKIWTAHDEPERIGHYALPGGAHKEFGLARNWHFTAAIIWIASGVVYYGYMLTSGEWRRLIPTSWSVFPDAWADLLNYLHLQIPPESAFQPYDALQQITYAFVVFVLSPLMVFTALAMSPAFIGRFPGYLKIFGGRRQVARSLHFLGMVAFSFFILIHVTMVGWVYFYRNVKLITFGTTAVDLRPALIVFISALLLLLVFNVWITVFTLNNKTKTRKYLTAFISPVIRLTFGRLRSRQQYSKEDISGFFRINGYPPETTSYKKLQANDFKDWKLKVEGLVETPLELSLADIKKMPKNQQITKHNCIQGWSSVAEWGGVQMQEILRMCKPNANAKYVVFHAYDKDGDGKPYYESLRISDMDSPQTILAYEMNYNDLPIEHGAPLRLRCEHKLGYKMVKYLKSIEFVDKFDDLGAGCGGYREDNIKFDWEASI